MAEVTQTPSKQTRKRVTPVRADLDALHASCPGNDRFLSGRVLAVHDDNFRWLADASVDLVLTDPPFNRSMTLLSDATVAFGPTPNSGTPALMPS